MNNRLLGVYLKWFTIIKYTIKLVAPLRLAYYIYKHDFFGKGNPVVTLKVLCEYLRLEKSYLPDNLVKYRNVDESIALLTSLINNYSYTGSSRKLSQILTVIREDFLERDKNDK